jgi:hypothetical protein
MEFTGRSVDPEGRPAALAEFYGVVTARMEDALLHCTKKMITYTDRQVPLAQLGKMSQGQSRSKADDEGVEGDGESKSQAELTLIFCYRDAVAINRKVDPDAPILIQQQRIEADDLLAYDRRTGDFMVPRKGKVYLYDHNDTSSETPESQPEGVGNGNRTNTATGDRKLTPTQRTVSTTSGRPRDRGDSDAGGKATSTKSANKRQSSAKKGESKPGEDLPLTLMQIHFNKGMRGRFGTNGENDTVDRRWSEFYGDVQAARANVATSWTKFDFDRPATGRLFQVGPSTLSHEGMGKSLYIEQGQDFAERRDDL